jgi:hypothetical protein
VSAGFHPHTYFHTLLFPVRPKKLFRFFAMDQASFARFAGFCLTPSVNGDRPSHPIYRLAVGLIGIALEVLNESVVGESNAASLGPESLLHNSAHNNSRLRRKAPTRGLSGHRIRLKFRCPRIPQRIKRALLYPLSYAPAVFQSNTMKAVASG